MKLTLTEVQQREIARVLLQCSGNVSDVIKVMGILAIRKRLSH
jgi:hypothetical protein